MISFIILIATLLNLGILWYGGYINNGLWKVMQDLYDQQERLTKLFEEEPMLRDVAKTQVCIHDILDRLQSELYKTTDDRARANTATRELIVKYNTMAVAINNIMKNTELLIAQIEEDEPAPLEPVELPIG